MRPHRRPHRRPLRPRRTLRPLALTAAALTLVAVGLASTAAPATAGRVTTSGPAATAAAATPGAVVPLAARPGGRVLLREGDEGRAVRALQARLAQIDWFHQAPTGYFGPITADAVRGFQVKRGLPGTGVVDVRTMRRLRQMTSRPSPAQLQGRENTPGPLDQRCRTGRAICVDKTSRTVRWVVDGEVRKVLDARFGGSATPTREGTFRIERKSRDHVSSLYGSSMPFAMFFSGGQAVHYSPDFAAVGYAGASHGCVNVRDRDAIRWVFDRARLGDKVIVYRS